MISSVAKGEKPGKGHKVGGGEQVEVGHSIVAAILAVGKVKALLPLLLPYYLHRIPKGSAAQRKKIKERKKESDRSCQKPPISHPSYYGELAFLPFSKERKNQILQSYLKLLPLRIKNCFC